MEATVIQHSGFDFLRFSRWVVWACIALFWVLFSLHVWDVIHISRTWRTVIDVGVIGSILSQAILYAVERKSKRRMTAQ
jgi:hypothetical protein